MNRHSPTYSVNDQLSLDDLRAYQAGQLSGPARHRVERLLLENPYYADALDGLDALQQVGGSLKAQTRDLHLALQERVHESATTRRLMPLWVTSMAASVLLVLSVSIYLIFNGANSQKKTVQAVHQPIEAGTVLINPKDLGASEVVTVPKPVSTVAENNQKKLSGHVRKALRKDHRALSKRASVAVEEVEPAAYDCLFCAMSEEMLLLPKLNMETPNRRYVNTERAFLN